jgi:hypothetical protein
MQFYQKGPVWYICYGKSTTLKGGQVQLDDYVNKSNNIPIIIKDLLAIGFERNLYTILIAIDIPYKGVDRIYVIALIIMLESTLTAGF